MLIFDPSLTYWTSWWWFLGMHAYDNFHPNFDSSVYVTPVGRAAKLPDISPIHCIHTLFKICSRLFPCLFENFCQNELRWSVVPDFHLMLWPQVGRPEGRKVKNRIFRKTLWIFSCFALSSHKCKFFDKTLIKIGVSFLSGSGRLDVLLTSHSIRNS